MITQNPELPETIYLAISYHQHQPFYIDYEKDILVAPWVRTHSTKDYYRMASLLRKYPNVHATINLSPSLLIQIQEYYIDRLKPFVDLKNCKFNVKKYFSKKSFQTDPLFDLLVKPTENFNQEDNDYLYSNSWSALSVNEVVRRRFPEYERLYHEFCELRKKKSLISNRQKLRELKFWFTLVNFDLDILDGPVRLTDGNIIDLSDLIEIKRDHKYYLKRKITETDCQRLAVETYKMFINVAAIHSKLQLNIERDTGQIELTTNPYSHPILPLIYDSNDGKISMPHSPFPKRFSYPIDADNHVKLAIKYYKKTFGKKPLGMWPSEGAVSEAAAMLFQKNGVQWISTDIQILKNSLRDDGSFLSPYRYKNMAIFFRDTELSDRISFKYQHMDGEEAASDFIKYVLTAGSREKKKSKLLTVIIDGENAWEWYHRDREGREFLNSLYKKLEKLYKTRQIVTVTPSEYLLGNERRGIPPHPIDNLPVIHKLATGSWICADFSKWIGTVQKNLAWEFLLKTRGDFKKAKIPDHSQDDKFKPYSKRWYLKKAWEELYIAEGSDWFWWSGEDQESYSTKKPFDELFYQHLKQVYLYAYKAGYKLEIPVFPVTAKDKIIEKKISKRTGTMKAGRRKSKVVFICDARNIQVPQAIYITGNCEELSEWVPNITKMYNDGTHGSLELKDNVWAYELELPEGTEIQYKYTNSGKPGEWGKSEEFPALNRTLHVKSNEKGICIQKDLFGKL
ncbi:MAG: carbohydrate-binding module family 20 domain-containing protein [Bacteroidota bacterium]|nr:carbohydrate-binding module family 20 domain-containing protein [Bacteroidota bacterium]